ARAGERLVHGVPVDWTVTEGELPLWRDANRPWGADYIAMVDEQGQRCHRPPTNDSRSYRATIRATFGELSAETALRWTEAPQDRAPQDVTDVLDGSDFERSPLCEGPGFPSQGCGCHQSGSRGSGALTGLMVLLLGWRLRARVRATT
ncbi:MAG: hypothetical protein K0V04_36750, partial [Deltaproteobacteria bacterium]|nr:hypothetical protein [Deltaproteobacteria bacterium]